MRVGEDKSLDLAEAFLVQLGDLSQLSAERRVGELCEHTAHCHANHHRLCRVQFGTSDGNLCFTGHISSPKSEQTKERMKRSTRGI